MKKNIFVTVKLGIVLSFGLIAIGCVSTVKLSPELTKKNAATLNIEHKTYFLDRITKTYYDGGVWSLKVKKVDGESVDWKQNGKETNVLIPEGEHILECWLQTYSVLIVQSIRVNLDKDFNYLRSEVYKNKDFNSLSELFKNLDDIFYFSVCLNNRQYYTFTYKNTPQFHKDRRRVVPDTLPCTSFSVILNVQGFCQCPYLFPLKFLYRLAGHSHSLLPEIR